MIDRKMMNKSIIERDFELNLIKRMLIYYPLQVATQPSVNSSWRDTYNKNCKQNFLLSHCEMNVFQIVLIVLWFYYMQQVNLIESSYCLLFVFQVIAMRCFYRADMECFDNIGHSNEIYLTPWINSTSRPDYSTHFFWGLFYDPQLKCDITIILNYYRMSGFNSELRHLLIFKMPRNLFSNGFE